MPPEEKEPRGIHRDVVVGLALMAGCAIVVLLTTTFRDVPAMLSQNVPPTFFPRLVSCVIALLSLVLVVTHLKAPNPSRERVHPMVLVTAGICTVAVALVALLGMSVTSGLAAVALALAWGERGKTRLVLMGIAVPLAMYLVFALLLGMRFPRGLLW